MKRERDPSYWCPERKRSKHPTKVMTGGSNIGLDVTVTEIPRFGVDQSGRVQRERPGIRGTEEEGGGGVAWITRDLDDVSVAVGPLQEWRDPLTEETTKRGSKLPGIPSTYQTLPSLDFMSVTWEPELSIESTHTRSDL